MSKETGYQPIEHEGICPTCGFKMEDDVCWNCKYREKEALPQDDGNTPTTREDAGPPSSKSAQSI